MTNLMIKSTIYDALSMIIPGYLLVQWGDMVFLGNIEMRSTIGVVITTFTLSYIVGIIFHYIASCIFNPILKNKINRIKTEYNKLKVKEREINDKTDEEIKEKYFTAYYNVLINYSYTAVPILEAQVSFVRSIICVIQIGRAHV